MIHSDLGWQPCSMRGTDVCCLVSRCESPPEVIGDEEGVESVGLHRRLADVGEWSRVQMLVKLGVQLLNTLMMAGTLKRGRGEALANRTTAG